MLVFVRVRSGSLEDYENFEGGICPTNWMLSELSDKHPVCIPGTPYLRSVKSQRVASNFIRCERSEEVLLGCAHLERDRLSLRADYLI